MPQPLLLSHPGRIAGEQAINLSAKLIVLAITLGLMATYGAVCLRAYQTARSTIDGIRGTAFTSSEQSPFSLTGSSRANGPKDQKKKERGREPTLGDTVRRSKRYADRLISKGLRSGRELAGTCASARPGSWVSWTGRRTSGRRRVRQRR